MAKLKEFTKIQEIYFYLLSESISANGLRKGLKYRKWDISEVGQVIANTISEKMQNH